MGEDTCFGSGDIVAGTTPTLGGATGSGSGGRTSRCLGRGAREGFWQTAFLAFSSSCLGERSTTMSS